MKISVGMATALLLAASGSARAQPSSAIGDFQTMCMTTHAVPAAVFSAADAAGWAPKPDMNGSFAKVSGNPDGRVIAFGTRGFRAVTAGVRPFGQASERNCVFFTPAPYADLSAALNKLVPGGPDKQSDKSTTWRFYVLDGVLRSSRQMSPYEFARALRTSPMMRLDLVALANGGSVIAYSEVGEAKPDSLPETLPGPKGSADHFEVYVEQDGKKLPLRGEIRLHKRAFALVFVGDHRLGYSVLATLDDKLIPKTLDEPALETAFNPFSVGAEGERDSWIGINPVGAAGPGRPNSQFWFDDAHGDHHRFASVAVDASGVATSIRKVDSIIEESAKGVAPLESLTADRVYLLITGRPPVRDMHHVDPKSVTIVFY